MNDEFGVDGEELSPQEAKAKATLEAAARREAARDEEAASAAPKKPASKKPAPKKPAQKAKEPEPTPEPEPPRRATLDPEDDRENWPTIHIEMEDGKPNYEFLAMHGTKKNGQPFGHELQVMRGVDVKVPPSIVNMLRMAVAAHYVPTRDPQTGKSKLQRQDRSSVPWRLIHGGKYIQ